MGTKGINAFLKNGLNSTPILKDILLYLYNDSIGTQPHGIQPTFLKLNLWSSGADIYYNHLRFI